MSELAESPGPWAGHVWLNGSVVPAAEARVSVFDRGFLLGDGVYETVRVVGTRMFRWPPHRDRLLRSLAAAEIELPFPPGIIEEGIRRLLSATRLADARVRLTVTRGEGGTGFDLLPETRPNVAVAASPWRPLPREKYEQGVEAIIPAIRQTGRDNLDPAMKSISRIHLVLARREAARRGAHEAILLGSDGSVREGTASNVFAVLAGRLATPSLDCGVLEGVTREAALQVASEAGVPQEERRLERSDLEKAEEIFVTNTSWGVLPVNRLDGRPVGSGSPGPVGRDLGRRLEDLIRRETAP